MSTIGKSKRTAQSRVLALFREEHGYTCFCDYLAAHQIT